MLCDPWQRTCHGSKELEDSSSQAFSTLTHAPLDPRAAATQAIRVTSLEAHLHPATQPPDCVTFLQLGSWSCTCAHKGGAHSVLHQLGTKPGPLLCVYRSNKNPQPRGLPPEPEPRVSQRTACGCLKACQAPPHQRSSKAELGYTTILP